MGRKSVLNPYILFEDPAFFGSSPYLFISVKNMDFLYVGIKAQTGSATDTFTAGFFAANQMVDGTYTGIVQLDLGAPVTLDQFNADAAVMLDVRNLNTLAMVVATDGTDTFETVISVSGKVGGA
jgi:hypothetical protein